MTKPAECERVSVGVVPVLFMAERPFPWHTHVPIKETAAVMREGAKPFHLSYDFSFGVGKKGL